MEPAPDNRRQLGQIMVEEGFVTADQLQHALGEQSRTGAPLGKVLVDLGLVSPGAVANALAEQHGGLLRTEYGTSTGLGEPAARPPLRAEGAPAAVPAPAPAAAAPAAAPVSVAPSLPAPPPLGAGLRLAGAAPAAAPPPAPAPVVEPIPEPAAPVAVVEPQPQPEPEPEIQAPPPVADHSERVAELESKLHAVLTERNALAQSLNEAQARLAEAAQTHQESVAAGAEQRIQALEAQLQGLEARREELERAHADSSGRLGELEARLAEKESELHEALQGRESAQERAAALESELEHARSQPAPQEHSEDHDALVSRIAELDQLLHAANAGRDEAAAQVAALEPELASVRDRLREQHDAGARVEELERALEAAHAERDSVAAHAGTPPAEVAELRRQVSERDRELADSVSEMAKMTREHRALLQLVERQLGDEERGDAPAPERTHVLFVPAASGYTLVERDGVAPAVGAFVELSEPRGRFVVRRLGPSPLPGPKRRCAYLERV
jgi:hypothetical protein